MYGEIYLAEVKKTEVVDPFGPEIIVQRKKIKRSERAKVRVNKRTRCGAQTMSDLEQEKLHYLGQRLAK